MNRVKSPIFEIPYERVSNVWMRNALRLTHVVLEWALGLAELERLHAEAWARPDAEGPYVRRLLGMLGISAEVTGASVESLPKAGGLLVVANHPFGGAEGLVLLDWLQRVRPDVKVMANFLLSSNPGLVDDMIFVDPFASQDAVRRNVRAMRAAKGWLGDGHVLVVFPAGEVSSFDVRGMRVRDAAWSRNIATLLRKANGEVAVLPVFVQGRNSLLFYALGLVHPVLRTVMLPRQLLRRRHRAMRVEVGSLVAPSEVHGFGSNDVELLLYLRLRTYLLAERGGSKLDHYMSMITLDHAQPQQEEIVAGVSADVLEAEVRQLSISARLLKVDAYEVYQARAQEIPMVLEEIGRLREVAFRHVGEGSGKGLDLDEYDARYVHLILWNAEKREVVGSYRVGEVDRIVEREGVGALYTRSLFKFDTAFLDALHGPALELGRSFIRPEYQKGFLPLLLLWRGVMAFVCRHPRYTVLLGPVSITHEYQGASRGMLLHYLRMLHWDETLADLVSARLPPKFPMFTEWNRAEYHHFYKDPKRLAALISEVEGGKRDIPVLIRQYLKLNAKLVAFNVDPDFSTVVDGLIVVDLLKAPPKALVRYTTQDELIAYHAKHGHMLLMEVS